jgi:hypothetical protein
VAAFFQHSAVWFMRTFLLHYPVMHTIKRLVLAWLTVLALEGQAQPPISASVQMHNGRPMMMLNGRPQNPMIYALTDVPGGRWSWEELPRHTLNTFCQAGFNLVQVDLFFDHIWRQDGNIYLDTVQKQLRGVLDVCPGAAIFIRFHVNPPKWWQHQHPEENTLYADTSAKPDYTWGMNRIIEDDEETPERTSLASTKWIEASTQKLKTFLQQLQSVPEANAIAGFQLAGGVYGEWHYWGFIENDPDISAPMLLYFKDWVNNKYKTDAALQKAWNNKQVTLTTITLPTLQERHTTQAGIFRNPQTERKIIDYYEAQHTCVADDILHFCRTVKENWPRPIITGAFYGYFYAVFGREAVGGHLELMRVLNSPYIDFLSGPGTYYPEAKEMGDPYRSRSLINSVALHGKLWLDEMDQQPPLLPLKDSGFATSVAKSIANVRRNVLFTFTKGMGLWFYDFGPSGFNGGARLNDHGSWGWWDEPHVMKDIQQLKKLLDKKVQEPFASDADVLLVHDTRSFYYTGSAKAASYMAHWTNNWIPPAIFKAGVVHDVIHIDDLSKINLDQYKVIVFTNTWVLDDEQKKIILERVAKNNRHLVFLYAPGYCNGKTLDIKFIEQVTGMHVQLTPQAAPTIITVNNDMVAGYTYSIWNNAVDPMFTIDDKASTSLGKIKDTILVAFARKTFPDHTNWYSVLPSSNPVVWRTIFRQAGAHIYNESGDILYSGAGILSVHTAKGGQRSIQLKNGQRIDRNLPPNCTILLDSATGEIISAEPAQ